MPSCFRCPPAPSALMASTSAWTARAWMIVTLKLSRAAAPCITCSTSWICTPNGKPKVNILQYIRLRIGGFHHVLHVPPAGSVRRMASPRWISLFIELYKFLIDKGTEYRVMLQYIGFYHIKPAGFICWMGRPRWISLFIKPYKFLIDKGTELIGLCFII